MERLREGVQAARAAQEGWEGRAMELEAQLRAHALALDNQRSKMSGSTEAALEQQQLLVAAKQKYLATQTELEELRNIIEDQAGHLEGYRNKYLLAQQQVEEQRRQLAQLQLVEADQEQLAAAVQREIQRVKAELQDKLRELLPLPDVLRATQDSLRDEQQRRLIAEHNCVELSHELSAALEKSAALDKELELLRAQHHSSVEERQNLVTHLEAYERKCEKLKEDIKWLKQGVVQMEEAAAHNEKLYGEKVVELARAQGELEAAREQASRQAARLRDRAETMRHSFSTQIAELERELAQSRASAAAAQKDKEELQQKLQTEVSDITQSFTQAQDRIKNLQSVVDVLKSNVLHNHSAMTASSSGTSNPASPKP